MFSNSTVDSTTQATRSHLHFTGNGQHLATGAEAQLVDLCRQVQDNLHNIVTLGIY
jgi:hypothetical protein